MTTHPTWLNSQIYEKMCELQHLCTQLQYTGTIIVDPDNTTIIQDTEHTCSIPTGLNNQIISFGNSMEIIKADLVPCGNDQIFLVSVPTEPDPNKCFTILLRKYKKATDRKNYNRINALAYAFHMGVLLWYHKDDIKTTIGRTQSKIYKRVFYLFQKRGYDHIYRTSHIKVKDFNDINVHDFDILINFCDSLSLDFTE